ncbi:MAG: cytidine 5'-phosphate N-acetylneuraminic acid synthetase [Deltaproteobacteria bacterium]|jgi:spore coat polysaccharide biosynthesis predicted glycosyltransferase SpsG/CMP-2-keto-3-deoxyoctulosonic acid synthetase|nr:cytidine 5'-phosphate N-acetylneuraminic acid synthetase [Deltaproteobacteria bacterium]
MKQRCIVIPAIKKNAAIPDQLVKKLAGTSLIERAILTARAVARGEDVLVVTDSQEITLICERNGVRAHYNRDLHFASLDIVVALRSVLARTAHAYEHIVVYRASCPLVTWVDVEDAYRRFAASGADCLMTVKSVRQRVWQGREEGIDSLLGDEDEGALVESKALVMLRSKALLAGRITRTVPYFLNDRAIEINSYQDWWICEKLLARRNVVFVVAGYPAIGMGHVYRALMLAHEIADHGVSFLCTRESEIAVRSIAERDYKTLTQQGDLAEDVLALQPDLVINDILDTDAAYIRALKEAGVRVVNFEDEGSGAGEADLVINALYSDKGRDARFLYGARYFCLRDEFASGCRNVFRPRARTLLVSFGGTDPSDFTRQTLDAVEPVCRERGIDIRVVAGPGYAHREALERHLAKLANPRPAFTHATNVMSRMMEGADAAICSAGRTVYELAHMRVPAVVMAHHERELSHRFARAANGFFWLGLMQPVFHAGKLRRAFLRMLDAAVREKLFERQSRFQFAKNKSHVIQRIMHLLGSEG